MWRLFLPRNIETQRPRPDKAQALAARFGEDGPVSLHLGQILGSIDPEAASAVRTAGVPAARAPGSVRGAVRCAGGKGDPAGLASSPTPLSRSRGDGGVRLRPDCDLPMCHLTEIYLCAACLRPAYTAGHASFMPVVRLSISLGSGSSVSRHEGGGSQTLGRPAGRRYAARQLPVERVAQQLADGWTRVCGRLGGADCGCGNAFTCWKLPKT
jgi:hypothetical protein